MAPTTTRQAAGALLWRPARQSRAPADIELAIIHRPRYDDWSWPKGGAEPGEHLLQTAAREVREETGYDVALGPALGSASHDRPGGKTVVHWWGAQVRPSAHVGPPQAVSEIDRDEVDTVMWVSPAEALRLLSYRSDKAALRRLISRPAARSVVLLVRHASAGSRSAWTGADALRPLDPTGTEQAARLAEVLGVFAPDAIRSADLLRCEQTVQPLADLIGCEVSRSADLSDSTWERRPSRITAAVKAAATAASSTSGMAGTVVLCSQGGAIPAAVQALAAKAPSGLRGSLLTARARNGDGQPRSRKGSVWVLGFSGTSLVGADYLADLAPTIA